MEKEVTTHGALVPKTFRPLAGREKK